MSKDEKKALKASEGAAIQRAFAVQHPQKRVGLRLDDGNVLIFTGDFTVQRVSEDDPTAFPEDSE